MHPLGPTRRKLCRYGAGALAACTRRAVCLQGAAAFAAALAMPLRAQARYPEKPITLVVPFAPGGIADLSARAVGEAMQASLGQTVIIDNRPSAGSIVATQHVAGAPPDGYTLLLMTNGHAVSEGLFRKLPYDVTRAFVPVSTLGSFDLGLFAAPQRFGSLRALLAEAKARPGRLNVGTVAVGSTQHLAAKLFETLAGIEVLVVPYKASPAVLTALRSGEIDLAFEIVGPMVPHVAAGAVRALAVTADRRNAALPDVPTVHEAGVAGYDVASWNAIAAPAGTPPEVIERLNRAVRDALAAPPVQDKLGKVGMRLHASTPAELQALLLREIRRWGEVIRAARIETQ